MGIMILLVTDYSEIVVDNFLHSIWEKEKGKYVALPPFWVMIALRHMDNSVVSALVSESEWQLLPYYILV